jgi:hypothetical protein
VIPITTTSIPTTTTTFGLNADDSLRAEIQKISKIIVDANEGHSYSRWDVGIGRYNCADFTHSAVIALRNAGYTAYPVCGNLKGPEKALNQHYWTRVEFSGHQLDFESITGRNIYVCYPISGCEYDPNYGIPDAMHCFARGMN